MPVPLRSQNDLVIFFSLPRVVKRLLKVCLIGCVVRFVCFDGLKKMSNFVTK